MTLAVGDLWIVLPSILQLAASGGGEFEKAMSGHDPKTTVMVCGCVGVCVWGGGIDD